MIEWKEGKNGARWSHHCDFPGNTFKVETPFTDAECEPRCARTPGCSHFYWSTHNRGTCLLKSSATAVSTSDAHVTIEPRALCGIVPVRSGQKLGSSKKYAIKSQFNFEKAIMLSPVNEINVYLNTP